ncbi:MAG: hypothetical protein AB1384_06685 [Actinomycetota bacterium]
MSVHGNGAPCSNRLNLAVAITLSLLMAAIAALAAGCGEKGVSLEYEPQPGLCVVKVERGGGLPYPGDDLMPLFQLYGDGRCIRYQEEPGGGGGYVRGELDEAAMAGLLGEISQAGYFDLEDSYVDPDAYDVSYRTITVDLAETEKTVVVDMLNEVPTFDEVYELILQYPVGATSVYVPEQGYLVVVKYPLESVEDAVSLDPNGDVFKLLPDLATLYRAAADHVAVAVDGATFMKLKEYYDSQAPEGLYILQPDAVVAVYPVYEPRIVDKP